MNASKKITILTLGLGFYIASALLTFSWTARVPEARLGSEGLSFLCTHPFGFPIKDDHRGGINLTMNCFPDPIAIWGQIVNLGAWLTAVWLSYAFYSKYSEIEQLTRREKLKLSLVLPSYIILLIVIYFLAFTVFYAVPPFVLSHLLLLPTGPRVLIQTR